MLHIEPYPHFHPEQLALVFVVVALAAWRLARG